MKIRSRTLATGVLTALYALVGIPAIACAQAADAHPTQATVVLSRNQASAILPPSVFFSGRSASIQGRNSAGLRMSDGKLVLVAVVDTSGYSSALQQTYQAYLLTEVPLTISGQKLAPGAYGFGFVADNKMVVMDVGGNEILHATTTHDESLPRPNPLQILPDGTGAFRLYLGRSYVALSSAPK
jgi:hypothetical protein